MVSATGKSGNASLRFPRKLVDERLTVTVERDGQPVALLTPPVPKPFTVADFLDLWERIPHPDDAFGDEVEATQAAQG